MRRNYMWGWQIYDMGYRALPYNNLTDEEKEKSRYVHEFLDKCVHEANCGWYGIVYCVCDINGEDRTEFALMFACADDIPPMARWINVTGDSKGGNRRSCLESGVRVNPTSAE